MIVHIFIGHAGAIRGPNLQAAVSFAARVVPAMQPVLRRHSMPARGFLVCHQRNGPHVQLQFTKEEQEKFKFPKAAGYSMGDRYVDDEGYVCHKGEWATEKPMIGYPVDVGPIETQEQADGLKALIDKARKTDYDKWNGKFRRHGDTRALANCVRVVADIVAWHTRTPSLVPPDEYVAGADFVARLRDAREPAPEQVVSGVTSETQAVFVHFQPPGV